jgi:signal transduction histidine kinase
MDERFRMLGRLATGVAQDLSKFLWVVELSLLKLELHAREAALGECVAAARAATQNAQQLSGCLLAYAQAGSPAPTRVDLAEVVHRVLELFEPIIPERVEVVVRTDGAAPLVIDGIAAELEQLLLYVVLHACDAMPEGGLLEMTVRTTGSSVTLDVADSGRGLRPGLGLDLRMLRSVADRHAATLEIGDRPDGGSAFVMSFPQGGAP